MPVPRSMLTRRPMGDLDLELIAGGWPEEIAGEVFVAASDQVSAVGGHAFFGDGVIARLSLRPGRHGSGDDRFAWRSRRIDSPSARLRDRHPDLFHQTPIGTSSPFGSSNSSNTAPLPWGDRLFVTWDAGRPVEVDPHTLRWLGDVGHRDDWSPALDHPVLPLVAASAHPVIDPERGCMWSVSHNPVTGEVSIIRYAGDGPHVDRWPITAAHLPQSTHTLSQTGEWLIIADCAFRPDPTEIFGLGPRGITTNTRGPAYFVRKALLDTTAAGEAVVAVPFEIGETMHFYAAHDDRDGVVVVLEETDETDLCFMMQDGDVDASGDTVDPALVGMYNHPMSPGGVALLLFDPERGTLVERAALRDPDRCWSTQLSAMDWSTEGQAHPTRHHQVFSGWKPELVSQRALELYESAGRLRRGDLPAEELPGRLVAIDRSTMRPAGDWGFAVDEYPCSPCFVPRRTGTAPADRSRYAGDDPGGHDGWVVVPVLSDEGFRVELFDAANPSTGPSAVLRAVGRAAMPFLLHAAWMPEAGSSPDVARLAFADDLDDRLDALPEDLQRSVRAVAAELAGELLTPRAGRRSR